MEKRNEAIWSTLTRFEQNTALGESDRRDAVRRAEAALGKNLPSDYLSFMARCNGGEGFVGDNAYLVIWRLQDLVEFNRGYLGEDAPELLLFGSDGGGEAYAFRGSGDSAAVVQVPFIDLGLEAPEEIASSFDSFIAALAARPATDCD